MNQFLDNQPLSTHFVILIAVVAAVGYFSDDLSLLHALLGVGAGAGGAGVWGQARAQSGKGVRR